MRYDDSYEPPAPVVKLSVCNPFSRGFVEGVGKIDTGADITVIPIEWVRRLSLMPASVVWVQGYDGRPRGVYMYYVEIKLQNFEFPLVKVIASNRRDALIGRDILNKLKIELDGKTLSFELLDP